MGEQWSWDTGPAWSSEANSSWEHPWVKQKKQAQLGRAGLVAGLPEASLAALRCAAILTHPLVCVFPSLPVLHSE